MKTPAAAQRTLSLFTGKTDVEDERARDGTPAVRRELPAPVGRARLHWTNVPGCQFEWRSDRPAYRFRIRSLRDGGAELYDAGELVGRFARVIDASVAAEGRR